jgi:hypothetical protein
MYVVVYNTMVFHILTVVVHSPHIQNQVKIVTAYTGIGHYKTKTKSSLFTFGVRATEQTRDQNRFVPSRQRITYENCQQLHRLASD